MSTDTNTARLYQLLRDNGFSVSVFHNPGSLWGTMPAHVEIHAVRDGEFWMARAYTVEHADAEYVAACQLAELCDFDLE